MALAGNSTTITKFGLPDVGTTGAFITANGAQSATAPVHGVVTQDVSSGGSASVALFGDKAINTYSGLTVGTKYYVSPTDRTQISSSGTLDVGMAQAVLV